MKPRKRQSKIPNELKELFAVIGSDASAFDYYWRQRWTGACADRIKEAFRGRAGIPTAKEQAEATCNITADAFKKHAGEVRKILAEWVEEWIALEHKSLNFRKANKEAGDAISEFLTKRRMDIVYAIKGPSLLMFIERAKVTTTDEAVRLFLKLITHPLCHRAAKCKRCGSLYFRGNERDNRYYCGKSCSNSAKRPSAKKAAEDKLAEAKRWLAKVPDGADAKEWVIQNSKLTRHWLTRQENAGTIQFNSTSQRRK